MSLSRKENTAGWSQRGKEPSFCLGHGDFFVHGICRCTYRSGVQAGDTNLETVSLKIAPQD
jgi:hypothetical protein